MSIRILAEKICLECNGVGTIKTLAWRLTCFFEAAPSRPVPDIVKNAPQEETCPVCDGHGTVPAALTIAELKRLIEEG